MFICDCDFNFHCQQLQMQFYYSVIILCACGHITAVPVLYVKLCRRAPSHVALVWISFRSTLQKGLLMQNQLYCLSVASIYLFSVRGIRRVIC